jgi:hypothetical protein
MISQRPLLAEIVDMAPKIWLTVTYLQAKCNLGPIPGTYLPAFSKFDLTKD